MELVACFVIMLVFGTPGVRLLGLWHRTGQRPEGLLAIFFLGFALGIPASLYSITHRDASYVYGLRLLSMIVQLSAMSGLVLFTQQVFRANGGLAKIACAVTIVVYAASLVLRVAIGEVVTQLHWSDHVVTLWALATVLWAFVECVAYYARMRRQARMGLGDPVVRNRFLLWAVWTGSFVLLPVMSLSVKAFLVATTPEGEEIRASPELLTLVRSIVVVCGALTAGSLLLSFFPPARYVIWLRGRATA